MRAFRRPGLWLAVWGLLIAAVVVGALLPARALPSAPFNGFDKLEHGFGYALLAAFAVMLFARLRTQLRVGVGLVVLGIGLEFAQAAWTSSRSGDAGDVLANLVGVLAGLLSATTPLARLLQRIDAWLG